MVITKIKDAQNKNHKSWGQTENLCSIRCYVVHLTHLPTTQSEVWSIRTISNMMEVIMGYEDQKVKKEKRKEV